MHQPCCIKGSLLTPPPSTSTALYQSIGIGQVAKPSLAACCCCCCLRCCFRPKLKKPCNRRPASVTRQDSVAFYLLQTKAFCGSSTIRLRGVLCPVTVFFSTVCSLFTVQFVDVTFSHCTCTHLIIINTCTIRGRWQTKKRLAFQLPPPPPPPPPPLLSLRMG